MGICFFGTPSPTGKKQIWAPRQISGTSGGKILNYRDTPPPRLTDKLKTLPSLKLRLRAVNMDKHPTEEARAFLRDRKTAVSLTPILFVIRLGGNIHFNTRLFLPTVTNAGKLSEYMMIPMKFTLVQRYIF